MRKKLLEDKENHNWRTFTDLIKILNHFGCLNNLELSEVGQTVGAIRSENELWIGLVLVSGYFCLLYTSPSPRDNTTSRMPSSA